MGNLAFRGLRLPRLGAMSGGFSPASLFAGNNGVWLDRSDLSTLFQDEAGTTPVTAATQLDALKLDKSQGLALGPQVLANNDFSAGATSWLRQNEDGTHILTFTGGTLRFQSDTTSPILQLSQIEVLVVGKTYEVTTITSAWTSGSIKTDSFGQHVLSTGVGTTVLRLVAVRSDFRVVRDSPNVDITLDSISIRLLSGNHAVQTTAGLTSRYQISPFRSQYDGADDFSATPFRPTLAGTIAVRMNSTTASRIALGSQPASDGRCYIGLASDGALAGGIGTQATAVIKGSTDIRGVWTTGILTWDGTTVTLYQDGVSVYSAAQSGAVNTTIAMHEGGLNNNGTASSFTLGGIAQSIVLDRVMTPAEIANITTLWSNIS